MSWRETLSHLREELAQARLERQRYLEQVEAERRSQQEQLSDLAASLAITRLLDEMNAILVGGKGRVETETSWDTPDEGEEDPLALLEDGEDELRYITTFLSWDEDGEREIAVDLGFSEEGIYLQVNEVDVRADRQALEQALVQAFRDELQL
jgi:hypothetical protein